MGCGQNFVVPLRPSGGNRAKPFTCPHCGYDHGRERAPVAGILGFVPKEKA